MEKLKLYYKSSQFGLCLDLAKSTYDSHFPFTNSSSSDIKTLYEKSKLLEFYTKALLICMKFSTLVEIKQKALMPFLRDLAGSDLEKVSKLSEDDAGLVARLIYVKTIIDSGLLHKKSWDNV